VALGSCLGALIDYTIRQPVVLPPFAPLWVSLAGGALLLVWAVRATPWRDRLEWLCLAGAWFGDAAASEIAKPRILIIQALCLGAWGALIAQPWLPRMPASLSRSGAALCIAAISLGFLPGVWKLASLALAAVVLLIALWIIDDLESKGVVIPGDGRMAGETRSRTTRS
jgi:hypothetical protein